MKSTKKKIYSLSIFYLKDHVLQDSDALQDIDTLENNSFYIGEEKVNFYSRQNPSHNPPWVKLFTPYMGGKLDNLSNSGCAAVLLIKRNNRYFAITFGYGRYLLHPDCFEENFGLRVVVNAVDPSKLRSIDIHTLESIPVHRKNQASIFTNFSDFGLNVEQDLMYAATGTPKDKEFCKTVSGKDALKVSLPFELDDLSKVLEKAMILYNSKEYKKNFSWIDRLAEVRNNSIKDKLDKELVEKINKKDFSKTWLSIPEVINWENVSGFRYQKAIRGHLNDDISWESYLACEDGNNKVFSIDNLRNQYVHCISIANEYPIYTWKIYQCIYCELIFEEDAYSLTNGKWYKIDRDFLKNLDDSIQEIPVSDIHLPSYTEKTEEEYNKKVVNNSAGMYVLMDKQNISYGGGVSKIELCDIYSNDKKLIHVKRYGGSSVLSHLFSQGLISTELILSDGNFRALVNKKLPKTHKLPAKGTRPNASEFEVIYVIASGDKKTTVLDLPLFSKINLRSCYNRLQLMGVSISLRIVPIVENSEASVSQ